MNIKNLEERSKYLGNPLQMYGVEKLIIDEGSAKGSSIYNVRNGAGLEYRIMADNALDIGELYYKGTNIHFLTKNGHQSPFAFQPFEWDFVHTFPAGMLYTCGLRSTGGANRDESGTWHPAHGRFHSIPATECSGKTIDNEKVEVSGKIRETQFNGHALEMQRTISSPVGENYITLTDKLTNCTPEEADYMILYHFNFGYPFLCPDLKMTLPKGSEIIPRDDAAKKGIGHELEFTKPVDKKPEEVFFDKIPSQDGYANVVLENPVLGIGSKLSWKTDTLPITAHWKYMRSGEYVLGIEPTNSYIMGKNEETKNGTIGKIKPFETIEMQLKLEFYYL